MKLRSASLLAGLSLLAGCAKAPESSALQNEVADLRQRNTLLDESYRRDMKAAQAAADNLQRQFDVLAKKQKDDSVQVYSDVIKAVRGVLDNFDDKLNRAGAKNDSNIELLRTEIRGLTADLNAKADLVRLMELKNRTLGEDEDLAQGPPAAPLKNQLGELGRLLVPETELEAPGGLALTESKGTFEKRLADLEDNVQAINARLRLNSP
jgi:hypothetical protein